LGRIARGGLLDAWRLNVNDYPGRVFTGLVREVGTVASFDGSRLEIESSLHTSIGDSVAVDGVCLTVVANDGILAFDAVAETLARTTLGNLSQGARVNLEPALRVGDALGGHYVQGHIDGVATVRSTGDLTWFGAPPDLLRYVAEKGSVAVAGTSLTVAAIDDAGFAVALIPHTREATTLGALAPGDRVNLEVDILAKYVERALGR
jgi:riboflavin synthase